MISQILTRSRNAGANKVVEAFTLVELLLVLVLIAISMATIMPRLGRSIPGWQVRESSKSMLATIRLARLLALTRQDVVVFVVDANDASFAVRRVGSLTDSHDIGNDFLVSRQFLGENLEIVQLEGFDQIGNEKGLAFWPDGKTKTAQVTLATKPDSEIAEWHIVVRSDGSAVLQEVLGNE